MRMRYFTIAAAVLGAAAHASPASDAAQAKAEAEITKILAGRVPGKPVSCIPLTNLGPSQTVDRTAIIYGQGRTLYLNRLPHGCPGLTHFSYPVVKTSLSQLCSTDILTIVDQGSHMTTGSCGLGEFVPYTKVAKAR